MVNGHEIAHGGLVFTLADTAFAAACNSVAAPSVAASAEIVFVAPARLGDELVADATERTRFGRSGLYDVTVRRARRSSPSSAAGRTGCRGEPVTAARRGRPGYDLASLLPVAVEVFNERGFDGTSMEDLSQRLGITKSAIYHHVTGKDQLLRMAMDHALDGLVAVLDEARALDAPAIDRLEHLVRGSVGVLQDRPAYVRLLLRAHGNTAVERAAVERRRRFDRDVAGLVRAAAAEGAVRPDVDPDVTARLLFGMVNSLIEWYRPAHSDLADAVCTIAFDGLRLRRE